MQIVRNDPRRGSANTNFASFEICLNQRELVAAIRMFADAHNGGRPLPAGKVTALTDSNRRGIGGGIVKVECSVDDLDGDF